jgi:uncharacterized membrane protein YvbJ
MYCPKCSQQQVSDQIRFCPRCGFQLDAVKSLLAGNQDLSVVTEAKSQAQFVPISKRDVILGATVMLIGAISIALLMISSVTGTPLQAVIIPLLLVWIVIVSILLLFGHTVREVTKLFSKDAPASERQDSSGLITEFSASARQQALPPIQSTPITGLGSWRIKTAELAQPQSITEHTTDLLDKK